MRKQGTSLNVAEAKRRLSELIGRVAFGHETVLITRRGKPMARLAPIGAAPSPHLADVRGWLDDDDPFLAEVDEIIARRASHKPRVMAAVRPRRR
jgi:prevent-host-death family protein